MTFLIISDLHTRYHVINKQISHAEKVLGVTVEQVFVLGDFGFFAQEMHDYFRRGENRFLRPVVTIEGNHEDHGALHDLTRDYADVVTHRGRGSLHEMGPWQGICLGGARYMNAAVTPRGSEITSEDVEACLVHSRDSVDMILTHDCPSQIGVSGALGMEHYGSPGVPQLTSLALHFQPRWWFFGHHHKWFDKTQEGIRYLGLPQSWKGYVLLEADGEIQKIDHHVAEEGGPWWKRWF